jgi:hypothetical protein
VTQSESGSSGHCLSTARHALIALALPAALAAALATPVSAATTPSLDELLARVGERIAEFYERAQHMMCIERSTVQPIDRGMSPQGFARIVESELRVEAAADDVDGAAAFVREVRKVNGRAPRDKDHGDRAGCTDPTPLSLEPLTLLLPAHRADYEFRFAGFGKDRNRPVFLIDFKSVNSRSSVELIEDPAGHADCFDWSGYVASRGRVWVDATSYDVVRMERGLRAMLDVRVPERIQRKHHLENPIVIEREDTTIRYRTVAFTAPDEVLLLPESIESLIIARGGLQSTRRIQAYSDYRRFLGDARIIDE